MKILLAQINPTIGDFPGNLNKILDSITTARKKNADIVLFPELAVTGYPPEDFLLLDHFIETAENTLDQIVAASKGIITIVGTPRREEGKLYNSAAIIEDGTILGYQDKTLLPTYDVFDEKRYFTPSSETKIWFLKNKKVAVTICEDLWQHSGLVNFSGYQKDPVEDVKEMQPELMLNLSASPFSVGKLLSRIEVCANAAKTLHCPVLMCNQVGGNDSLIYDGYSLSCNADGALTAIANGFCETQLFTDPEAAQPQPFSTDPLSDLYHALVLGVRDYFHKSGFHCACIALSGGIDSALVACIAVEALGAENIFGVALPSRYSSEGSLKDAESLAENLKITLKEIPIEAPFQTYLDLLAPHFEGLAADATEENLQARIRGMIMMAFSNKLGCVVLSTGNKSEMAMGYATLYGDMAGGLGVINDVTKQQVYALARWINRKQEIIPLETLTKPPSAELRPNQKDSDSLPDYEVIDNILHAYVVEHQDPNDIAAIFGYEHSLVKDLIRRIHANEYKRRQSPPGLRVSEKSFSAGRRFPIVQRWV